MSISSILFDVENIFFDGTAWHRWVHQQASALGVAVGYQTFLKAWQRDWLPHVYSGKQEYWSAMEGFLLGQALNECQVLELVISARSRQRDVIRNSRLLPGIQACLNNIKRSGMKLGVICNSVHTSQDFQVRLGQLGIRIPLDVCLTSRSAGRQLPDRQSFEHVIRDLASIPGSIAYVTTSAERLEIAQSLGLQTVHVDSPGSCLTKSVLPFEEHRQTQKNSPYSDYRATSIQEVFEIITKGGPVGSPIPTLRTFHENARV